MRPIQERVDGAYITVQEVELASDGKRLVAPHVKDVIEHLSRFDPEAYVSIVGSGGGMTMENARPFKLYVINYTAAITAGLEEGNHADHQH